MSRDNWTPPVRARTAGAAASSPAEKRARAEEPEQPPEPDPQCADCGRDQYLGHWEGDPLCPACWNEHTRRLGLRDHETDKWTERVRLELEERDRWVRKRNRQ